MICQRQVRSADGRVIGLDLSAAMMIGAAKGYDASALADLLPAIEAGLILALRKHEDDHG
ncbi:MAG: hypothetical protein HQL34_12385 [Alphaproteobacteria bacterium]|nr:hypothetical protein [Alphaproteobacteria bacterium]